MERRHSLWAVLLVLATAGGLATLSMSSGQPPEPAETMPIRPAVHVAPAKPAANDLASMPESHRRAHLSARSAAEWLMRADQPVTGRFHPGWIPALNIPVDRDGFIQQATATLALARAARHFGDERHLLKARQATLSLLAETQVEPGEPPARCTSLPPIVCDRVMAAALLLAIIHELPDPAADLLVQGDQLAEFLRQQQRPDGTLGTPEASCAAVHALMLSAKKRPMAWKTEVAAKALAAHRAAWKAAPTHALAVALLPALAETYVRTRERSQADAALEVADWLCGRQHGPEAMGGKWAGGFPADATPDAAPTAPTVASAAAVDALACACLVTRHVADAERYAKCRDAVLAGCQFLASLQYGESNTMHFQPAYRAALLGGFHGSAQDGDLRLADTGRTLTALIQRLTGLGDR